MWGNVSQGNQILIIREFLFGFLCSLKKKPSLYWGTSYKEGCVKYLGDSYRRTHPVALIVYSIDNCK